MAAGAGLTTSGIRTCTRSAHPSHPTRLPRRRILFLLATTLLLLPAVLASPRPSPTSLPTTTTVISTGLPLPSPRPPRPGSTDTPTVVIGRPEDATGQPLFAANGACSAGVAARFSIFCPNQVVDVALRTAAVAQSLNNVVVFLLTQANKRSFPAMLTLFTLLGHGVAVFCALLPFSRITPPSIYLTVHFNVGLLLLTSETFQWLLYLRVTAVVPIRHRLLRFTLLALLVAESLTVAGVGVAWIVGAHQPAWAPRNLRQSAANAYSFACVAQAGVAAILSGYFILFFYLPRLKPLRSRTLLLSLFTSGLFYLCLEVFLQLGFTLWYKLGETTGFYTGLNTLGTAVRHAVFLAFVGCVRGAGRSAEAEREKRRLREKAGTGGFWREKARGADLNNNNDEDVDAAWDNSPPHSPNHAPNASTPPSSLSTATHSTVTTGPVAPPGRAATLTPAHRPTRPFSWSSAVTDDANPNPAERPASPANSFLTDAGEATTPAAPERDPTPTPSSPAVSAAATLMGSAAVAPPPAVYAFRPPRPSVDSVGSGVTVTSPTEANAARSASPRVGFPALRVVPQKTRRAPGAGAPVVVETGLERTDVW
ncbi:hypothetical protein HDU96_000870 [Phlyctochytrium bullatum]|nr:hypothetical protein HDU96_000870 [Phlyctochytrium bullatum]